MGRDIKRYEPLPDDRFLILIPKGWTREQMGKSRDAWAWFKKNYPAIAKHLAPFAADAEKRLDKGEFWWELRACAYYAEFEKPKLILPDIAIRANLTLDSDGKHYCANTGYIIGSADKYLLGVLNSSLITFCYRHISSTYRAGYLRFIYQYLERIPIRRINFDDPAEKQLHDEIVARVNEMLALQKEYVAAAREKFADKMDALKRRIDAVDAAIDAAVYRLYDLSEEEIRIVEEGTRR